MPGPGRGQQPVSVVGWIDAKQMGMVDPGLSALPSDFLSEGT